MIPTLETGRLILRPHRREDFDSCAALWANPDVVRYIGGKPFTREEVWARLLRYAGHWQWLGFGFWALEEKETGAFAGELGFAEFMRDLEFPRPWASGSRLAPCPARAHGKVSAHGKSVRG
jgi:RimJ/RimL family protein N-acetyltransferase